MLFVFWMCFHIVLGLFRERQQLLLENLAFRQQLHVLRRSVCKPRLGATDRFFWTVLRRFWSGWREYFFWSVGRLSSVGTATDIGSSGEGELAVRADALA
jgi:hypothetical protein